MNKKLFNILIVVVVTIFTITSCAKFNVKSTEQLTSIIARQFNEPNKMPYKNFSKEAKQLISKKKANPNTPYIDNARGMSVPLIEIAIINADFDLVKTIVKKGGNVNINVVINNETFSPFVIASLTENYSIADYLLDEGADINILFGPNNNQKTLLMQAVDNLDTDLVKYLMSKNADPNMTSSTGDSAKKIIAEKKINIFEKKRLAIANQISDLLNGNAVADTNAKPSKSKDKKK